MVWRKLHHPSLRLARPVRKPGLLPGPENVRNVGSQFVEDFLKLPQRQGPFTTFQAIQVTATDAYLSRESDIRGITPLLSQKSGDL